MCTEQTFSHAFYLGVLLHPFFSSSLFSPPFHSVVQSMLKMRITLEFFWFIREEKWWKVMCARSPLVFIINDRLPSSKNCCASISRAWVWLCRWTSTSNDNISAAVFILSRSSQQNGEEESILKNLEERNKKKNETTHNNERIKVARQEISRSHVHGN